MAMSPANGLGYYQALTEYRKLTTGNSLGNTYGVVIKLIFCVQNELPAKAPV